LHTDWTNFTQTTAIQLNNTHPTIAIVEMMRIFVGEERMAIRRPILRPRRLLCLLQSPRTRQ
jgi:glucan phosphorylase